MDKIARVYKNSLKHLITMSAKMANRTVAPMNDLI